MMDKRVRRDMEFTQKYNLIELLAGDGVQSYRAVQTSTGRDVAVHLLVGGKTPENEALLVRLRAMQPQSMAKLVEVGEHRGNMFVVTVAPRPRGSGYATEVAPEARRALPEEAKS